MPAGIKSAIRPIKSLSPRDQRGFMLVELLVGVMLALVVFCATLSMLSSGLKAQTLVQDRASQLEQAQTAAQRLVRDLRQASSVTVVNSSTIDYSEPVATGLQSYVFSCSTSTQQCTRSSAGTNVVAITNVSNSDVFTASPNASSPNFVAVKLVINTGDHTPITVTDGVGLRNVTLGS